MTCPDFPGSIRVQSSCNLVSQEKNGSNQSFDLIKNFKSSVKSLCD